MALRMALGAGRTRMVRQMLTEALVLSFISGVAGVLAAKLTLSFILRFVPASVPRLAEVGIDRTVLLFAGNESRYDCRNSGRCSRLRLQR